MKYFAQTSCQNREEYLKKYNKVLKINFCHYLIRYYLCAITDNFCRGQISGGIGVADHIQRRAAIGRLFVPAKRPAGSMVSKSWCARGYRPVSKRNATIADTEEAMTLSSSYLTLFLPVLIFAVVVSEGRIVADVQPRLGETFYGEIRELLRRRLDDIENEAPAFDDEQLPPHPEENPIWRGPSHLGQISGVAVDTNGRPVIFHRGHRTWEYSTFNSTYHYQEVTQGPILQDTVLTLDPRSGEIVDSWGKGTFYMPHGLHIDMYGNVWLTDVALHQVFKFRRNAINPSLILGERFEPGSDSAHFCQPTTVAVAPAGEIIVADGYCNSRIMVFNAAGGLLEVIPQPGEFLSLQVPHGLALLPELDVVCVADRENMRVTCPNVGLKQSRTRSPPLTIQQPDLGRVFAVAAYGNYVYAVNGPTSPMIPVRGFTLDPRTEKVIDHWSPLSGKFNQPHAIAVCPNGTALYVVEIGPNKVWKFDLIRSASKK